MTNQPIYRRHILRVYAILLFLLSCFSLNAQQRSVRFQHLTIEDGLTQNMVDCMLQDRQGFMWFGTWNGLCRYDGYTFEVFNNEQSSSYPLTDNFIYALNEDVYGNIWIGTKQGLFIYLYDEGKFINVDLSVGKKDLNFGPVRSILSGTDSIMFVGSDAGLFSFRLSDKQGNLIPENHLLFGTGENNLRGSSVNALLQDKKGVLWTGTDAGLILVSKNGKIIDRFNDTPDNRNSISSDHIQSIIETHDGTIWVGTEYGLNRFNRSTNDFRHYFSYSADPSSLAHNTVMDLLEDKSNNLFVATLGGLSVKKDGEESFTNFKNVHLSEHSLSNDFVNCLLLDHTGNVWVGTERGGVNYYNGNQNTFEHFEYDINQENSLSNSTINSIFEDQDYLWIGTAGGGLNRYNKSTRQFNHFRHDPLNSESLSSDFITSILRDNKGDLWVGSWGAGLNVLKEDENGHVHFSRFQNGTQPGMVSNYISSIDEDSSGDLWIGTLGGLVLYDQKTTKFNKIISNDSLTRISEVGCILIESDQSIWVGTRIGLFHIKKDRSSSDPFTITKFEHDPADTHSISGNYVISMTKDTEGNLWFGTYGQGINKLHSTGDSIWFSGISTAEGLANNIIYGIQQDSDKNLWLSTDFGLSRLNPKTGKIRNFFIADGLLNNQYYWSASYKNKSGKLYFGGMNGLDSFYPDWINEEEDTPDLVITDIRILNASVIPGKKYNGVQVLEESALKAKEITLSYKEKIFGIEFSSLNFLEPDMIRYAYILQGFDKEWNYVSSARRYASYTNLTPGDYTFKVKASSVNGDFNTPYKELHIHIRPPFWNTPWFRVGCIILFAGLVIGYIRLRTYTLKRQKILLEKQVKHRTERINEQKEALSYQAVQLQNNNHELEIKQTLIEGQNHKLEIQNKEIVRQRDELINLNKKLKQVSQLKLSFFTNISHEFRTPLTLIISPIEKLLKENHFGEEVKHTLTIMNQNAQRLLHLINQIMDFRRIEKGRMGLKVSKGDINEFCKNVFRAFEPLSEIKEMTFTYQSKNLPAYVWFDKQKLENILYNLLSNAFKYTPHNGKIRMVIEGLTLKDSRLDQNVAVLDAANKTVISIKVTDTGIGISEENLPLVFKRFYRIESEEAFKISGSGIGLALTEELIKTHLGEIFVESELDVGSTFEVQLPCLQDSFIEEILPESHSDAMNLRQQVEVLKNELLANRDPTGWEDSYINDTSRSTVLVVDDNADLRKFIIHRLNKLYNILEAGDGESGIELAEKYNPDVIISDIMMPKVDGLKLCATLKNNLATSHIPLILLTAKSTVENQMEGLAIGADDYLPKPFNFEILEARIQNLVESRKQLRLHFLQSSDFTMDKSTSNVKDRKFLEHAIKIVESNIENPEFGVKEFIREMGISRSLLHKKLTSLTSQSAAEFINHIRMKHAMQLLRQNDLTISEVAYAVGYNDPKYFSRLFNKQLGQSPTEFLRKSLAIH